MNLDQEEKDPCPFLTDCSTFLCIMIITAVVFIIGSLAWSFVWSLNLGWLVDIFA